MKINRLETHDRLQHFTGQSFDIGACCQDLINQRPFGDHPFYIFVHSRSVEGDEKVSLMMQGVPVANLPERRIIWQPRLTKPRAQENSMLFKGYPGTDHVKIIWMLPPKELWNEFDKGKMMENQTIYESIQNYRNNKDKLEAKEDDDLSDTQIDKIYKEISEEARRKSKGKASLHT